MPTKAQNQQTVIRAAQAIGVPVEIALAQAKRESGLDDRAIGRDGERGLMQPLPSTWRSVMPGVPFDQAFDPETNLLFWQKYFGGLVRQFGDYRLALIGYNGGPGRVHNPRAAAVEYARAILAQAGASGSTGGIPADAAGNVGDSAVAGQSDWLQWLPYAVAGIAVAWFVFDD